MAFPRPSTNEIGFWINPCGYSSSDSDAEIALQSDIHDLLNDVSHNSQTSHLQAQDLQPLILKELNLTEDSLSLQKYDWLQSPPADESHFKTLTRDEALSDAYLLLQKFAVALEQMAVTRDENRNYYEKLLDCKHKLMQLLCSVHTAVLVLNVEQHPDASRDVMENELRTLAGIKMILRDYLIIRDYLKAVLYTRELVEFLKRQ